MNRTVFSIIGLLLIVLEFGLAQPTDQTGRKPIHCSNSRDLPRIDRLVNGVPSSLIDSAAIKQETEYAYHAMTGRWCLIQVQGGWSNPTAPTRRVELVINTKGRSTIYDTCKNKGDFTIQLNRTWSGYQSPLNPRGQTLFGQYCHYLDIELCESTLVLSESIGDGMEYVFSRSISK